MYYMYSAVIAPIEDGSGYYARIPDLPGCVTSGKDLQETIRLITDAMSGWLCVAEDEKLTIAPPSDPLQIPHEDGEFCTLVQADTIKYRAMTDTRAVRKNVSLPAWMATLADRQGVNCSQVLQEALRQRFGVSV